ncbi:carboxypeptidase-like regulatory domain-containing protein [Planctomicrobium sp. SH664]|uniref:carboxypeptidase-like regulatory domain-containing protein n=1 Tax=Planctomicrobium sp. SH664 TaxID=3448125 RepID=UPI003F5CA23A
MTSRSVKLRSSRHLAGAVLLTLVSVTLVGCGQNGPKIATVQGTVTLDGKPLPYAAVVFNSENGRPAGATTDENGHYVLNFTAGRKGATPGTHRVIITTKRDPWKDRDGKVHPGTGERLPAKYNSTSNLTFTVEDGKENVADFNLDSKGQVVRTAMDS